MATSKNLMEASLHPHRTHIPYQTITNQTKPNNTKMDIMWSFLKQQATDLAWYHIWTMGTHQMMRNNNKQNQNITKQNRTIPNNNKIGITRTFLKLQDPDFAWTIDTH